VALKRRVTASMDPPVAGDLSQLVDGYKEANGIGLVDLGPGLHWVQIDLDSPHRDVLHQLTGEADTDLVCSFRAAV